MRVAAPRIGNTELPPDDGFTWRKYGQKEILGSRFPRFLFFVFHFFIFKNIYIILTSLSHLLFFFGTRCWVRDSNSRVSKITVFTNSAIFDLTYALSIQENTSFKKFSF